MTDRLLEYIARSQDEQTRCLTEISERLVRVEEQVKSMADVDERVTALEHAHTQAKTALMLIYTGGGMIVSALAWLFTH